MYTQHGGLGGCSAGEEKSAVANQTARACPARVVGLQGVTAMARLRLWKTNPRRSGQNWRDVAIDRCRRDRATSSTGGGRNEAKRSQRNEAKKPRVRAETRFPLPAARSRVTKQSHSPARLVSKMRPPARLLTSGAQMRGTPRTRTESPRFFWAASTRLPHGRGRELLRFRAVHAVPSVAQ